MELRHLRYFVAVAEELSFTRGADRLHVAQPALSVQIRQLEDEIGTELLDRSRRAVQLTEPGRVLLDESRRLLAGLDQTIRLVQRTGGGEVGRLAIGFVPSAANAALPPILRRFRMALPDVDVHLREMAPDDLVQALHEGRLDICFLYLPFGDPALDQAVVSIEPFVAALPEGHPLASGASVAVSQLGGDPFILPARHGMPGLRTKVLDLCRDAGFTPDAAQDDVWLVQTIIGLVASGAGVALVPASAEAVRRSGVVFRPLRPATSHEVQLAAVWRRDDRGLVLQRFLEEVRTGALTAPGVS